MCFLVWSQKTCQNCNESCGLIRLISKCLLKGSQVSTAFKAIVESGFAHKYRVERACSARFTMAMANLYK